MQKNSNVCKYNKSSLNASSTNMNSTSMTFQLHRSNKFPLTRIPPLTRLMNDVQGPFTTKNFHKNKLIDTKLAPVFEL